MVHYRRDQANSLQGLSRALGQLGRLAEAIEASRRAIDLLGHLAADYPTVPEYRFLLAAAHHNLAAAFYDNSRLESAREEYRRAIEAMDVLMRREPTNPAYLRDLANSHMWLGNVEKRLREPDEAAREITRARDLFAEAARLRPESPEYRFSIAAAEHNMADALEHTGRLDLAEQGYRQSQRILTELFAHAPDNGLYARDLANSGAHLGRSLLARGQRSGAIVELTRALELWDGLLARTPRDPDDVESRAWTLILLGRIDEAIQAAETLADGKHPYAAACILAYHLARPGRDPFAAARIPEDRGDALADRALPLLARAVAQGEATRQRIEDDEQLDALRARFPALFDLLLDRNFPSDPFAH